MTLVRALIVLLCAWSGLAPSSSADDSTDPTADEPADLPRIVSLAPHLTELAYAAGAGDRLVGVVEWSDFPDAAKALPRIGDAFRFDAERILRLEATHALVWAGGTPAAAIAQLEALGLVTIELRTGHLDEIADALVRIGDLAPSPETARDAADRYRLRLERLRKDAGPANPAPIEVFYAISQRPLFTFGERHVINEVLALCGARNVFEGLDMEAGVIGVEALTAADPDVVLVGVNESAPTAVPAWTGPETLRAVRCGRLRAVDATLLVRPTPRILDGAEQLCRWLATIDPDDCTAAETN